MRYLMLAALLFAAPVFAEEPAPARRFGGCSASGFFCAGPSVSVAVVGFDLDTKRFSTGVEPGVGYGGTWFANRWYSVGASLHASIRSTSDGAVGRFSMIGSFAEFVRLGAGWEVVGATDTAPFHAAPMLFLGLGMDFGPTTK